MEEITWKTLFFKEIDQSKSIIRDIRLKRFACDDGNGDGDLVIVCDWIRNLFHWIDDDRSIY